uniref:Transposase n=1 Tax=Bursaphelenchus xylophilus TaxID=6326 RepID=A0A1I7SIH8_BURXY
RIKDKEAVRHRKVVQNVAERWKDVIIMRKQVKVDL